MKRLVLFCHAVNNLEHILQYIAETGVNFFRMFQSKLIAEYLLKSCKNDQYFLAFTLFETAGRLCCMGHFDLYDDRLAPI